MIMYRLLAAFCVLATLVSHRDVELLLLAVVAGLFAVVEAARPDEPYLQRLRRRALDNARREQHGDDQARSIWPT